MAERNTRTYFPPIYYRWWFHTFSRRQFANSLVKSGQRSLQKNWYVIRSPKHKTFNIISNNKSSVKKCVKSDSMEVFFFDPSNTVRPPLRWKWIFPQFQPLWGVPTRGNLLDIPSPAELVVVVVVVAGGGGSWLVHIDFMPLPTTPGLLRTY